MFRGELQQGLHLVAILPMAGIAVESRVKNVRRVYLRKLALHLYYTFDDVETVIRAVWGAHREHGPRL